MTVSTAWVPRPDFDPTDPALVPEPPAPPDHEASAAQWETAIAEAVGAPQRHAYGSVVWTLAGFQALHIAVAVLIAGFVSMGALTHSAPALDLGLDFDGL